MIWNNIEIHNAAELVNIGDLVMPIRYPMSLKPHLNDFAQKIMTYTSNTELRFVQTTDKPPVITVSSPQTFRAEATVFRGSFGNKQMFHLGPEPQELILDYPVKSEGVPEELIAKMPFHERVWRIIFNEKPIIIHSVEGECRPPKPEELPKHTLMTYGTSITHGGCALLPHLSYTALTAWRLGLDLINLGLGGSCHCEPEVADWIGARTDWDVGVLALSVNMCGKFSHEEFYDRVNYFVNTVAGSNTERPIFCVTLYPHFRDIVAEGEGDFERVEGYRERLREAVAACPHSNVTLVEGPDILTDVTGLSTDMIHPSDYGMMLMSENLSKVMKEKVSNLN